MKILKQGLSLALLGAGLAALPGSQIAAASPAAPDRTLVEEMRDEAAGRLSLSKDSATGKVDFARAARGGDLLPSVSAASGASAADKAEAFLDEYAPVFGAKASELREEGVLASPFGWTVSFGQVHRGLPVFGSQLKLVVDKAGDLTAVSGYAAPALDVDVTPSVSASTAASRAVSLVRSTPSEDGKTVDTSGVRAASNELVIYRLGSTKGESGEAILAHQVEVSNSRNIRDVVLIDAHTGKPVNRYSLVHNAAGPDRELYSETRSPETLIWSEGDSLAGLTEAEANLVRTAGESYWLFANAFDYESYDGANATMVTVADYIDPDPNYCPNANWNGSQINVCTDTGPDDITAHEWGHAYTDFTSGLIYQWQPGALNESYSDVWGETIDLLNAPREDDGETNQVRPVGMCSTHSPLQPRVTVNQPYQEICPTGGYLGPEPLPAVTADVVAPTDADEDGDAATYTTLDGCSTYDNPAAAVGKIVLVNRGGCFFTEKAQMAKDMGAAALIIGNRDEAPNGFSDGDQTYPPTVSIGLSDREQMRAAIASGQTVNVTIEDASGPRIDSYRWLMGEQSEAFGGAIRDMWNPTCHGDPGKVSDAQYHCSTDDNGGVHGNSGVPNHAYALVVDGGTYNGVDVPGIGLTKAAHVWWKAQHDHLTPVSDFDDMADALEASCQELLGAPIRALSLVADTPGEVVAPISPADCAAISATIAATEMRMDVTAKCDFKPLLQKNAPAVCGPGTAAQKVFAENFEDGLAGWETSQEVVYEGATGMPWTTDATPPGGWDSQAAYGPAPDQGECNESPDDFSSRDSIISPMIDIPAEGGPTSRFLSFDHYVATEQGYDGGNVKYRTSPDDDWTVIPTAAYVFNPPTEITTAADGNTNPLAGEPGFTGTDGGEVTGSWGESHVDLADIVEPGGQLQLRFDIGRDGCGGVDGWYVDNVTVSTCEKITGSTTTASSQNVVKFGTDFGVRVKVTKDSGGPASGKVRIVKPRTGESFGVAQLNDRGRAVFTIKRNFKPGFHRFVAKYLGNATTKPSDDDFKIWVFRRR